MEEKAMICLKCAKEILDNSVFCNFCGSKVEKEEAITPAVGSIIPFSGYDWLVLDVKEGKALLISEKVLEKRREYHAGLGDVRWMCCSLREYLNGEFYHSFNPYAKAVKIALTRNSNKDNPWYGTPGGNDTDDYIFLLSPEEVVRYFGDSGQLANRPSERTYKIDDQYNEARIAYRSDGSASWFRLRSPASGTDTAAGVGSDGYISVSGIHGGRGVRCDDSGFYGVRPALWINL
jgi:hypothetical protein